MTDHRLEDARPDARRPGVLPRRALMAGTLAILAQTALPALAEAERRRFAVIDWALLETVLTLGLTPLGAPELVLYDKLVVEPKVPSKVADLGLRGALSFERLALLRPDVVYGSNYSAWAAPQVEAIAPLKLFDLFLPGDPPLGRIMAMTERVARDFGLSDQGRNRVETCRAVLSTLSRDLASARTRQVIAIDVGDTNHIRVYGKDSLFGDVLSRLGLEIAWTASTRYSANAPVGMEALASFPNAFLIIVGPVPPEAKAAIETGALWQALPAIERGRYAVLPPCNAFGALPTAERFARLVSDAILAAKSAP